MQIILKEDIRHLGEAGDVVVVKDGYARNYLIPRDLAVRADTSNMKQLEHERRMLRARRARQHKAAQGIASEIDGLVLTFHVQTGEEDKMFGSVTSHDVERRLSELGHTVERRLLGMDQALHSVGVYEVPLFLHSDVEARLRLWVLPAE